MSFAFLTRRFTACDNAAALMPSVHAQTGAIRRDRLSVFFLKTVTFALSIGVSKKCLASKNCFATATLSNLGLPTRRFVAQFPHNERGLIVGNLVFRSLTGVPPIRPGTRAAFAIITSVDDTLLAMKYDAQYSAPGRRPATARRVREADRGDRRRRPGRRRSPRLFLPWPRLRENDVGRPRPDPLDRRPSLGRGISPAAHADGGVPAGRWPDRLSDDV